MSNNPEQEQEIQKEISVEETIAPQSNENVQNKDMISTAQNQEDTSVPEPCVIAPLEDLKKLFSRVKDSMLKNSTSVEALNEASNIVSILSAQNIASANPLTEDQSKFFYGEFFKEICQRASNCEVKNVSSQEAVAELIRRLFDLLATELKMQTPNCLQFASKMRHLFDCSAKFYTHLTSEEQVASFGTTSTTNTQVTSSAADQGKTDFNESEREWRLALDVGTTIDALKQDIKSESEMWSKATITAVTGQLQDISKKNLCISFDNDVSIDATYKANSTKIAPHGTLSTSQDWRNSIKQGDLVDIFDKYKVWNTATVIWLDSRLNKVDSVPMPMVKVGFRQYNDQGDKSDKMGMYSGYSEAMDEYIGFYSLKLQKPYSQTTLKDIAGNSVKMSDATIEALKKGNTISQTLVSDWEKQLKQDTKDMELITEDGPSTIVAVKRRSCASKLLIELLSKFSEAQGFESIIENIAKQETSLQAVQDLLTIVSNCEVLYHKTFVDSYVETLKDAVETKLQSANEKQLRPTIFQTIEDTVEMVWLKLMKRLQPENQIQIGKYKLLTKLGILFFKQNFMQKRIDGAIAIDMVCKRALQQDVSKVKETIKNSDSTGEVIPELMKTLQEADVIDLYFSKQNVHDQLVMRSEGVIGLFLSQGALNEDQLTMIWKNCDEDATYRNLISCLKNLSTNVKPNQLTSIIERVVKTPMNKIKMDEIELLMSLSFEGNYETEDEPIAKINQNIVLEFYWDFLTDDNAATYLNKAIANKAIFNFMDILKQSPEEVIESYFDKIQDKMRNAQTPFMTIKIGNRYFKERKVTSKDSLTIFADKLQEKFQMMQLIIEEINKYSAFINAKVCQEMETAESLGTVFEDSKLHEKVYSSVFSHEEQITERIEFLTVFAEQCAATLSKEQLASLWNVLVEQNKVKFDKRQLFLMLKNFVDVAFCAQENKIIALEDLCNFYRENIAAGLSDCSNLELEGLHCIQGFFILINSRAGKIKILDDTIQSGTQMPQSILKNAANTDSKSGNKVTSISSTDGAKTQNLNFAPTTTQITTTGTGSDKPIETGNTAITGGVGTSTVPAKVNNTIKQLSDNKLNLMMCVAPDELDGLPGLWRIASQAENAKVIDAVLALLIQIHTNLDSSLHDRISEFENLFINACVDTIKENQALIKARTDEQKIAVTKAVGLGEKKKLMVFEKRISLAIKCLTRLIQNSEKEGTFGLTSHRAFAEGTIIPDIDITNEFNYAPNNGYQKSFKIVLKSNMTMYQVKKLICKELAHKKIEKLQEVPPHPAAIKLVCKKYLDRPIKDTENGMLVQEIFLKSNDKIFVTLRGNEDILKISLLEEGSKKLNEQTKQMVRTLFERFAIAKPELPDLLFLGTEQVKELIEKVSEKEDEKPKAIMAHNTNEDMTMLLYEDFEAYYESMAVESPQIIRTNLAFVGIRSDMKVIPQPGDSDDILNLRKTHKDMPRYKISNEPRTFQTLLECLDLDPDTRRDANEILMQATTNERIEKQVLEASSSMFAWDAKGEQNGSKEAVYTLSMVEQILYNSNEDTVEQEPTLTKTKSTQAGELMLKDTWVPRFLKSGGLNKLIEMLENVLQQLVEGKRSGNILPQQILQLKEILSCTLKIVKVFITAIVCGSKDDMDADLFSIKQQSSALSKRLQQGNITSIITNKYLRRADQEEEDLEAKLEKSCTSKAAAVSFFGLPLKTTSKSLAKPIVESKTEKTKEKTQDAFIKPEEITEDFLFGNDITYGEPAAEQEAEPEVEVIQEKKDKKQRIHFFEVTARYTQIARQIKEAMQDTSFELDLDYDRLLDFCLEAVTIFMYSLDKDLTFERSLIKEALDVWCACVINSGEPLSWARKPANIHDGTSVHNFSQLIREGLTCAMPEVRRYFFQSLSLVSEQLSQNKNREHYQLIIHELVDHLINVTDKTLMRQSEEIYELLADCCLHQYHIEKQLKNEGTEFEPSQDSYKDVLSSMMGMLKRHNSYIGENENLQQAKNLESLLLSIADVFSFFKQQETYENILSFLNEQELIDYVFYEVIFFVPEKTQCEHRNKAKRSETRKAAYQLLYKLLKFLRPSDMVQFLEEKFVPMVESVPRPVSWSHLPNDKVRRADEQVGIKNLGNVCYMISMLQQFFMVPAFRYSLLKVIDDSPENKTEYKDRMIDDNMMRQLQMLFGQLEMSQRSFVDPTEFCFSFKQWDGKPTNTGEQRDAQEFLNEFFDKLEDRIKDSPQKYLLADTFQGSIISQKKCESCNHVTRALEPFYTQTLYIEHAADVHESLKKQLTGDIISDYRCEACSEKVDLRKSQILGKLPNVLILHLQRIVFDFNTFVNKKLTNRFEFPLLLDLSDYSCKKNINLSEEEKADPQNKDFVDMLEYDDDEFVYRLVGINIHRGQANSGHYWSLIHMKRGEQEPDPKTEESKWNDLSNNWREFNDETVGFFMSKNIPEQGYGGYMTDSEMKIFAQTGSTDWSKSAYMLVYEKKLKSELRQVTKEEGNDEEIIEKIKFNEVKKEIPDWIKDAIVKDNRAHVADSQVFHPLFFTFSSELLKHCVKQLLDQEEDYGPEQKNVFKSLQKLIMETGHKLSFDLLSHFKEADTTKAICSSLRSVFSWSDSIEKFGRDESPSLLFNFIKKVLHEDKCEYLFKIMYDSTSQREVREQVGRTVNRVVGKAIKIIETCKQDDRKDLPIVAEMTEVLQEVMLTLISILSSRTFQSKWSRLEEYFEMISDIGLDEKYQAKFLLQDIKKEGSDDLVTILCDFIMQQKSPKAVDEVDPRVEMGGNHNKPAFGPLVSLACHLVRSMWTKQNTDASTTFAKKYKNNPNDKPQNMMEIRIDLPDIALEYFTNSDFFEIILSNDYAVLDYAKALAHVCFGNEQLSKKICKLARDCCYEGSRQNYLIVLNQILRLNDVDHETGEPLKLKRLEWVFGSPQPFHTENEQGQIKIGLESNCFNINQESYNYVTALCYCEDEISVLELLLKSYLVKKLAADQAQVQISPQDQQENINSNSKTNTASIGDSEIEKSTVLDQLRAQGIPDDQVHDLVKMLGDSEASQSAPTLNKSKSDSAIPLSQEVKGAKGVTVDKYLDLEPLKQFMRIVKEDEISKSFFAQIPGFTYQYARYTDWISQYLDAISTIDKNDSKALTKDQKSALSSLRNMYAVYEDFLQNGSQPDKLDDSQDAEGENVSMVQPAQKNMLAPGVPLAYMPLKTESEAETGLQIESNGLTLTASILKCKYVDSRPNNQTNLAVQQSFLTRFGSNKPSVTNQAQDSVMPTSSSIKTQADEQGGSVAASDDKYKEPDNIEQLTIDMDDPAIQHALTSMLQDQEFSWIFELPEQDKMDALQNICKEQVYDGVKDYYKSQSQVDDSPVIGPQRPPAAADSQDAVESQSKNGEAEQDEGPVDDPFTVWKGDEIKSCDDLVYVLRLTNATGNRIKYKIQFKEGMADSEANLIWPREGLLGTIGSDKAGELVALLPKARATSLEDDQLTEIQKLQVTLVAQVDQNNDENQDNADAQDASDNQGTNENKHDVSVGGDMQVNDTEKQCGACTMFNPIDATDCYICQTKFNN